MEAVRPAVLDESSERRVPEAWSPGGRDLFFTGGATTRYGGYLRPRADGKGYEAIRVVENSRHPRLSPDGRSLVYQFAESNVPHTFVRQFPGGVDASQISVDEGRQHRWSPDGKEVFFTSKSISMAVSISAANGFSADRPQPLFRIPQYTAAAGSVSRLEVLPDGQFVLLEPVLPKSGASPSIHVVLNWPALLKAGEQQQEKP